MQGTIQVLCFIVICQEIPRYFCDGIIPRITIADMQTTAVNKKATERIQDALNVTRRWI